MVEVRLEIDNGTSFTGVDLMPDEILYWNKQFNDIKTFDAVGSFTRDFRIPATPANMQLFGDLGIVNFSGWFDFRIKADARLFIDGILISDGHIQIRRVYRDAQNGGELETASLDLVFYSEMPNLAKAIGDAKLADITDIADLDTALEYASLEDSVDGTLAGGNVIYTLIDRGQNFAEGGLPLTRPIYDENLPLYIADFTPCVNALWLWQKIFSDAGFYYESTSLDALLAEYWVPFINDRFVKTDVVPEGELFRLGINADLAGQSLPLTITADFDEQWDNGGNCSGGVFTAPHTGYYTFRGWLHVQRTAGSGSTFINIILLRNDLQETQMSGCPGVFLSTNNVIHSLFYEAEVLLVQNDTVKFHILNSSGAGTFTVESSASYDPAVGTGWELSALSDPLQDATVIMSKNAPDMKQVDFIRSIIKLHNLVLIPDQDAPNKLTVELMVDYLGSGTQRDYTDKLDISKDVQIYPTNEFQKRNIEFTYAQDSDFLNILYQREGKRTYGRILFDDTGNDFAQGDERIELSFASTPCGYIPGTGVVIPRLVNESGAFINPKPRLLYKADNYDGIKVYNFDTPAVVDTEILVLNHYQGVNAEVGTNDLNFGIESPQHAIIGQPYQTAYNRWWRTYMREIYGGLGADDLFIPPFIMEAYFNLSSMDVHQLQFSDTIWIIDSWWRVLDVIDHAIGQYEVTKMRLIKVIDVEAECLWTPYQSGVGGLITFLNADGVTTGDGTEACCEKYGYIWNSGNSKCYASNVPGNGKNPSIPQLPGDPQDDNGSVEMPLLSISATYTIGDFDKTVIADATSGAITVNLPAAASSRNRMLTVKKVDASANAVTLDGNSAETIDGAGTYALTARWQTVTVQSDGNNWFIIAT